MNSQPRVEATAVYSGMPLPVLLNHLSHLIEIASYQGHFLKPE